MKRWQMRRSWRVMRSGNRRSRDRNYRMRNWRVN
jgi:hypothetical protein